MTEGFIYCFSNASMPGILKIGMSERTPDLRLGEANASDTWRPPTPYKIEVAIRVCEAKKKEKTIHALLEQYTERIHPRREFFRVSKEEVYKFFDLMDGEKWTEEIPPQDEEGDEESFDGEDSSSEKRHGVKGCRDMAKCFTHGQRIRHKFGINKIWMGTFDSTKCGIVCAGSLHRSPSGFAMAHYSIQQPDRRRTANGWLECECEVDGKWISIYSLPG